MAKKAGKHIPEGIVCISSTNWFPIPTRKQQVMSRIPKGHRILYVEPPITLLSPIKDRSTAFKLTKFLQGWTKVGGNIVVYTPPPVLPFGNIFSWINRINQWWLGKFVARQVKKLKLSKPLVWTYMPNSGELVKQLDYQALIYDCVDEHSEYQGFINKDTMLQMERQLIQACDLFFVTASGLYESKKQYNPSTYLIPNGANFELFNQADSPDTPIPEELEELPKPIIGFVGVIQEWIDLELLEQVARAYPRYSLVLVGPVGAGIDVSRLEQLPNVHLLGKKTPEELPGYLKAFAVCLNPFRECELTNNVSPLKFYEYLATGKPIVTVDMPAVRQFADSVLIAQDGVDFINKVDLAIRQDTPELKERRLAWGRQSSWENKVQEMLTIIDKKLGEKEKNDINK